jgi:hypothetical protein
MKRIVTLGVICGVAAALAAALAFTSTGRASGTTSYVTKQRAFAQVDVGKKGFSIGDSFIFSEQLLQGGKAVGYDHVVCTHAADWPRSAEHCSGTVTLGASQLILAGDARRGPFTVAIVGGTGRYTGARGTADIASEGARGTLTVHLR